ncbi:MAG: glycosyltransferase [Deltaproteobacteria bacterium]|nr:glycosyltransferase [Deltaproteobacteria bacterium]
MRVLWISERFPPDRGGASVSAGRQVEALAPACEGLDVVRLTSDLAPGRAEVRELAGGAARLIRVGRTADDAESLQLLAATAENLIRAEHHDLVHGFFAVPAGHVAVCVARLAGLPVSVSLRGNDVDRAMFHGPRFPLLAHVLHHADAVIGVSREILAKVTAIGGRVRGLHLVHNGIDTARFAPPPSAEEAARIPLPEVLAGAPRPWLAFAGELRLKKGLPVLEALAERLALEGVGTLVCVGGLRADAAASGERPWARLTRAARARVREVPFERDVARLAALYAAMDLFVFPSLWDGLPNAMLEAMACARPVLATRVGGIPDAIEDGVTGFLLAPGSLDRFPERALELLASPERLAATGRAARAHVARAFTPEAERDAHLAVWRGMLA